MGRYRHNPNQLWPLQLGGGGPVNHCPLARSGDAGPPLPHGPSGWHWDLGVRHPFLCGWAADSFGHGASAECPEASRARSGGSLPVCANSLTFFKAINSFSEQDRRDSSSSYLVAWAGKTVLVNLWGLESTLVSDLREGAFVGQSCLSLTESPGPSPVSGHL